jgi:Family of unknown function (DUF5317)
MRLTLITLVTCVTIGILTGGALRGFPTVKVRWWWLAVGSVGLQFLPIGGRLSMAALLLSFVALIVFTWANVRVAGFGLILVGLALNALVIAANQGMPVSGAALRASDQADTIPELIVTGGAKHHLADEDTVLRPLGDVIPLGSPVEQAISIGDVFVHGGMAWFVVSAMPRRRARTPEPELAP